MAAEITRISVARLQDAHAYLDELISQGYEGAVILGFGREDDGTPIYHYEIVGRSTTADRVLMAQVLIADELDALRQDDD